jgi:prepilin-type N-terminal cleavage/methylation domain-containing protein
LGHSNENEKNLKSRPKAKKFFGFTLAEVLITLGIIGVVSAMTIPALINKCQKVVLANQAKKEYAMWTQVFKSILADNNTTSLSETELWGTFTDYYISQDNNPTTSHLAFWAELGKYVKISPSAQSDTEGFHLHDARKWDTLIEGYPIFLANGSKLRAYYFRKTPERKTETVCSQIKELGGSMCNEIGWMYIDVNGAKGPNIMGRDIFWFYLSDEGVLYPVGGKDDTLYSNSKALTSSIDSIWKTYYKSTKEQNAEKEGFYRAGQLMEEGWKMTY